MNLKYIYKVIPKEEWQEAKKAGIYLGSSMDLKDGYIHFSEQQQIKGTLFKHFKGISNLILLKVETINLESLLWEQASDGNMFPHLYSSLKTSNVIQEFEIKLENQEHVLPTNL